MNAQSKKNLLLLLLFSIAFAFVESSIVVYLRAIYYPEGFSFPLETIRPNHLYVELAREAATIVMLLAAGIAAGSTRWERFGYFIFAFGVWDIFYYVWLKVILDWPRTIFDWDILFLIPIPWISPVIAPVLVSLFLIGACILILKKGGENFHPSLAGWGAAIGGSGLILFSFMNDTFAALQFAQPQPYLYEWFFAGLALYIFALLHTLRTKQK